MSTTPTALFTPGDLYQTPGAEEALTKEGITAFGLLQRHVSGDWGDLSPEDAGENAVSLRQGFRILSAYLLPHTGIKLWLITEADRSATTILLPDEY